MSEPRPKRRLHVPIHYLVLVLVGVAVLIGLLQVFGRTDRVLIGWLVGFLVVSRLVDLVYRRRRKQRQPRVDS
jgi:Flp pilus assembly protein TadB